MAYVAEAAGTMDLHVWVSRGRETSVAEMSGQQGGSGGEEGEAGGVKELREPLPGSPFTVVVSEGSASATGSYVREAEAKAASAGAQGVFVAGEHIVLRPQVRSTPLVRTSRWPF
jgi:hypothetical protein